MVIRKMNSVFTRHGRILFAVITIFIIFSFVGFLTPGFNGIFAHFRGAKTVGTVFGKKVSSEDVSEQARRSLLFYSLMYGNLMDSSQMFDFVAANAFPMMCSIAAAKERGITVSDAQVAEFIQKLPLFQNQKTKQFDPSKLKKFIETRLAAQGLKAADLDRSVREMLIVQELDKEISNGIIVTNDELKQYFKRLNEKFYVRMAQFEQKDFVDKVKPTDMALKQYFEQNRKNYTIPASYNALLVKFEYENPKFSKAAATGITEADLKEFYDNNKKSFMSFKPGQKPAQQPFEQVKAKVKKMLIAANSKNLASEEATRFAQLAYDKVGEASDVAGRKQAFLKTVNEHKVSVFPMGWVDADAKDIKGIEEPELIQQISETYDAVPVSNAVVGQDATYVAYVTARRAERPAKFAEVKEQVSKEYIAQEALKQARNACRELAAKLAKMNVEERAAFVKNLKAPKFKQLDPCTLLKPAALEEGGANINMALIENVAPGNASAVSETPSGAKLAFVEKRELPSDEAFEKDKEVITRYYKNHKYSAAKAAFTAWMKSNCKEVR